MEDAANFESEVEKMEFGAENGEEGKENKDTDDRIGGYYE